MSENLWLSMSVWGHEAGREAQITEAMNSILDEEQLMADFANSLTKKAVMPLDRVEGGRLLLAGSRHAVVVSGSAERFADRVRESLAKRAAEANANPCETRFAYTSDEDSSPHPSAAPLTQRQMNRILHAAGHLLADDVEGYRGEQLTPAIDELVARYFEFPAWAQRDEMAHLLCDLSDPRLEPVWRDLLRAPAMGLSTARHFSHMGALCALENTMKFQPQYFKDAEFTGRIAARVAAGMSPREARAAEYPDDL